MPEGNPLVAAPKETTTAVTGIGIAESCVDIAHGVSNGDWVEAGLGVLGAGLEVLSMVIDPLGTLASYGVSWLIEHVKPLKEALDWFAGDPPVIRSFSQTWENVSTEVSAVAGEFMAEAKSGTAGWTGQAGDAYRGHAGEAADALSGASALAGGISAGVMIMGEVVAFVREFIRDMVGELVGRLIAWALEVAGTLGLATPLVVGQAITAITKVVNKVADVVRKLVKTIGNVAPRIRKVIDKLDEIIQKLAKLGRKADGSTSPSAARTAGRGADDAPTVHGGDGTSPSSTSDGPGGVDTSPNGTRGRDGDAPDGSARPTDPQSSRTPEPNRVTCNDPVDVVTGEVIMTQTDVALPGALPLVLRRTHVSSYRVGRSFGRSWASTVDQRLEIDDQGAVFVAEDGMLLVYPEPSSGQQVLPEHGPRWPLTRTDTGFAITQRETGHTLHFAAGAPSCPLAAITDRNDNRIDFDRDGGTVTAVRHSAGYHVDVESRDGRVSELRLRNPDGPDVTLTRFGYDDAGHLSQVYNSSGRPLSFDYDPAGRLTRWTDRNGIWYAYLYDERGRCIANQGSGGFLNGTFSYDTENQITRFTDALASTTTYLLNDRGNVVAETDPLGNTTTSEWDEYDRLLSRTDPLGRTTRYEYDAGGNPTTVTRPDGTQILLEYNEIGLPTTVVEPDGAVWRREYDQRGNLRVLTDPAGATTRYDYDERGNLASVTDPLGTVRQITSSPAGLIRAASDGTRLDLDMFGRVTSITDPLGGVSRLSWTVEGQMIARVAPDGGVERYTYDGEGNLLEYADALGRRTRYEYRGMDLPVARTGPDGARLEFDYDSNLRLTSVTNPRGLVWRYEYDGAGNVVRETDFNGRAVTYAYNEAGELVARTNGAGETVTFTRDVFGQVITKRAGAAATTFAYDPAGRMTAATTGDIALTFEHDALGNVIAETVDGRTVRSAYDAAGRRVRRLTPSGAESRWTYDAEDRPLTLDTAGRTVRFGYDAAGREVRRELGAAVLTQSWDGNHQLRAQRITAGANPVQQRVYHYRPDGAVIGIDDELIGSRRFELDPAGRVTAVHGRNWTERYAYDAAGNTTAATVPAATPGDGPREYAGTLIRRAGTTTYRHDAQGRVVERQQRTLSGQRRVWTYTWDADDRLVGLTTPDGTRWSYAYDALGRRVRKQRLDESGAVAESTVFVWDGFSLAEQTRYPDANTTTWDWEPDGSRPVTQIERVASAPQEWVDAAFYALVTDLIGTPTEMLDAHGNVAWTAPRTLWGRVLAPPAGPYCPLRFPGQYHDRESGLDYNLYRYYDAESGRFASGDPLGLAGGVAPHSYVPNPLEWSDPLGLTPQCVRDMMRSQKIAPDLVDKGVHVNVGRMEVKIVPTKDGGVTFKPVHPGMANRHPKDFDDAVKQVRNAMEYPEFRDWVRKHADAGVEMSRSTHLPGTPGQARDIAIKRRSKIVEFKALLKALDNM